MKKLFTTVLPDEPYKTSTKKNITIECTYEGPRYLLLRVKQEDGAIVCIDREADELEHIEPFKIEQHRLDPEGVFQVLLDASVNTWEAAYLTAYYTHDPFPDYEEILPTGEKWTYHYDDKRSAVEAPFYVNDMFYDKLTDSYKRPRYRVHAVAKADFWAGLENAIKTTQSVIDGGCKDYTPEQAEKLKNYFDKLKELPTKYKDIDHWKIPFPILAL